MQILDVFGEISFKLVPWAYQTITWASAEQDPWCCVVQGSFCVCIQPMSDNVALQRRLPLAGRIFKMIPGSITSPQSVNVRKCLWSWTKLVQMSVWQQASPLQIRGVTINRKIISRVLTIRVSYRECLNRYKRYYKRYIETSIQWGSYNKDNISGSFQ